MDLTMMARCMKGRNSRSGIPKKDSITTIVRKKAVRCTAAPGMKRMEIVIIMEKTEPDMKGIRR